MQKLFSSIAFLSLFATNLINSDELSAAKAIAVIFEEFSVKRSIHFDFLVYQCQLENLVDEIAAQVEIPISVQKLEDVDYSLFIYQSAILFFNDTTRFIEFHSKTRIVNSYLREGMHFFIYIDNANREDFYQFFAVLNNVLQLIKNTYFLMDSHGQNFIELTTFITFQ
jgi:hypothetical protein